LSATDFQRVFKGAARSGDKYLTVLWRGNDLQTARIGFAISKKRIASAVRRNRVRRIARESFRHHRNEIGNVDIVIMAQPAAQRASNADIHKSLDRHWNKIRLAGDQ
jgi:ribonuclease P protein component